MQKKKKKFHRATNKIDRATKKAILKEILNSKEFAFSQINKRLLKYLVDESIKNHSPTEYDIAINVFDRDANFNPNEDAIVRVSIHNLRKKLENFYLHEGKHAKIQLEIPKGCYEIIFNDSKARARKSLSNKKLWLAFSFLVLLALLIWTRFEIWHLKRNLQYEQQISHHPVFKGIYNSTLPKLIVLGDDFFFLERSKGQEIIVRKHNINSLNDLRQLILNSPDEKIKGKTPYAFIPMSSIKPLLSILPIFKSGQKISFQYSSALQSKDLLNNDIIFFGTFRNLYILNQIIKNQVLNYVVGTGQNSLTLNIGDSLFTYTLNGNPEKEHSDYCLVIKIPGPNQNTILLFISFFETGMIGALQYLTNPESLKELQHLFKKRYGSFPPYFQILFKTTGFSRTAFTTHIVHISKLDRSSIKW